MTRPLKPFEYFEPGTIEEATQILFKYGEGSRVLAGGVDLVARMRKRQIQPRCVVSIQNIPGLDYIESTGAGLKFGALATLRSLEFSPTIQKDYVSLYEAIRQIASVQVKNMGTAIGNLCVATPASDIACSLFALGAELKIAGTTGERTIPIENFFMRAGQTILEPSEVVTEVLVPHPLARSGNSFLTLVRTAADVSKINVAVSLAIKDSTCSDVKIVLGSVAPTVIRAVKAESILKDNKLEQKAIKEAAETAAEEAKPITDLRSTVEYRREMVTVLVARAIERAQARAEASNKGQIR